MEDQNGNGRPDGIVFAMLLTADRRGRSRIGMAEIGPTPFVPASSRVHYRRHRASIGKQNLPRGTRTRGENQRRFAADRCELSADRSTYPTEVSSEWARQRCAMLRARLDLSHKATESVPALIPQLCAASVETAPAPYRQRRRENNFP
jgi:hypothetical protein